MVAAVTPQRIFDGWYVVASVFILLMVNAGLGFYGLSVFLEAITLERGLSTASVSLATSIFFVVSAISGRAIAPVIQKHDLRRVVAAGAVIAATGLWFIGQSTRLVTLYPSYVLFAIGVGLSGLVPGTTLVTRWVPGQTFGCAVSGLNRTLGRRPDDHGSGLFDHRSQGHVGAAPWLSLIYLVTVAVSLIALWPDPAARGRRPDGEIVAAGAPLASPTGVSYDDAVANRFFRLVTVGFIFAMGAQVGGIAQLFKLGTERADVGAALVSSVAFASVIARLIGGVVASRVQLIAMTSALAAVQGMALIWLSQANERGMLIGASLLFGATIGNLLMLQPLVIADRFGVIDYPRIYSLMQLIVTGLGVAGGPYLLGYLHDVSSYTTSYLAAAVLSSLGAMVFLTAWRFAPEGEAFDT